MTLPGEQHLQKIQFYATTAYACGYLKDQPAQSLIATPHHLIDAHAYSGLIKLGFRRSGKFAYRPHCETCHACIPVRLPVSQFKAKRSQRRAWKQHQNLSASLMELTFSEEHFALYSAYQITRHEGGLGDPETAEQYRNFLVQSNVESLMVEFRENGILKMVSVVDIVRDGVSAVYTFYDASDLHASYGTYNVMWLLEWCKTLNLPYLYLGYWIKESRKMAYKKNFLPQEGLVDGIWQPIHLDLDATSK
ncbi:arginyltransferase [Methylobacillus caricis]|uniref:arginyltransferase n=1 Tax=Methylobacillus caricis TaxID=1971611 RepID=UPI001CFFC6CE|nr:arginyltransferase [Methylobacillus caricis]MCB5187874.1 arginyltransferase [Methylobacillus caricis]